MLANSKQLPRAGLFRAAADRVTAEWPRAGKNGQGSRIAKTCARPRIPALADMAHTGAGSTVAVPTRRPPGKEPTAGQRSLNRAHARLRHPVERGAATLERRRIFQHARRSPNWPTSAAKAVLTLELHRRKGSMG
ncbi:hypothetical protein [Kitasatospora phosalacinea]|uniref:hypothetical protein n=1 Tax=Kitasatospora phosalacinea TaxID=2065 RepID=UPI0012FF5795|nr:hypothetical protein [Kitasatospora phosalacinea]